MKADPAATAAHERNGTRRAQVDSDFAAVTLAEAEVAEAISKVFGEHEVASAVDLYAVQVGGTATGFSVTTHPMDPDFGSDLAMDMPICELLEAAQPVPKKSHRSQKNADDTDVEMTDAGGGGDDKPISFTCSPCASPRSVRVHLVTIAVET